MKDEDWDRLLRQSLADAAEPGEELNESLIRQLKERNEMKPKYKKRLSVGLLAAVLLLVLSVSAYAANQLFSAKQVAERLGDRMLAEAFESKDAVQINQSKASGDYRFTLHGLVSGAGLSEFRQSSEELYPDRTYAVVSIARQDGKPMPNTADAEYGLDLFFVSPLIKGQKPWQVNIFTMNGGYGETVIDGVTYRMIECDQVEIFADRGVYLAIASGTAFFSNKAFGYDEATGEVYSKEDYSGASLLFDLPLDPAKADRAKADAYLDGLLNPSPAPDSRDTEGLVDTVENKGIALIQNVQAKMRAEERIGETIPESIQEMTSNGSGKLKYSYDGWSATISPDEYFAEDQVGFSEKFSISGKDDVYKAVLFHKEENGVITGRIVILD
ncbi:hypothetical protein B1A99_31640 [Cohnella sp. CIP 111063]|nr:hypothetical protein B1A99_31640 [Cohnella sp. CIP 111063]PRX60161.1 hypothetical protein B0G52_12913 [Cohnella sp. SGD-V74]